MSIAAVCLTNLTVAAGCIHFNEGSDRRCTFAQGRMTVMHLRGCHRLLATRYRKQQVQTEKAIAARLIFDVVRVFPEICEDHLRIAIAIDIRDSDPARSRLQTRKENG